MSKGKDCTSSNLRTTNLSLEKEKSIGSKQPRMERASSIDQKRERKERKESKESKERKESKEKTARRDSVIIKVSKVGLFRKVSSRPQTAFVKQAKVQFRKPPSVNSNEVTGW